MIATTGKLQTIIMRHLKLLLAYDGTEFSGWQVQPEASTIQGTLASAIGRVTGEKVLPQGSGRTDAGVHALGQVATLAMESPIPAGNLVNALNDVLPSAIRVLEAAEVPAEFHARDFTSFAAVDPERGRQEEVSNVRQIFCSSWERQGDELVYTVRGNGFLHHMVRNLVGTFLLVGKGTVKPSEMTSILEARSRSAAGATVPAAGLCLVSVEY